MNANRTRSNRPTALTDADRIRSARNLAAHNARVIADARKATLVCTMRMLACLAAVALVAVKVLA
jgi:hypothetical protein